MSTTPTSSPSASGSLPRPVCSAWAALPPLSGRGIRVGGMAHPEPGHGAGAGDANGAALGSEVYKEGKRTEPTVEHPDIDAEDATRFAQECGLKAQVNRCVKHRTAKLAAKSGAKLSCGSQNVLEKFFPGDGIMVARNFFSIDVGVKVAAEELAQFRGTEEVVQPPAEFCGPLCGDVAKECATIEATPKARRALDWEKFANAQAGLKKRLAAAAAIEEAQVKTSRSTPHRRKAAGLDSSADKITLKQAQARMIIAVEGHHTDYSVGVTKARDPSPPKLGMSRMEQPEGPSAPLFFITAENSWRKEEGGGSYWVKVPLAMPRPGNWHRDRDNVKDGCVPTGGLRPAQQQWLEKHCPAHTHLKTNNQGHKHGQFSSVSQAMCNSIGFMDFLGIGQLRDWVESEREKYRKSEAAKKEKAMAAAQAAAEGLAPAHAAPAPAAAAE